MKKTARLLILVVLLLGSASTIAVADGPGLPPTCNPFGGCFTVNK